MRRTRWACAGSALVLALSLGACAPGARHPEATAPSDGEAVLQTPATDEAKTDHDEITPHPSTEVAGLPRFVPLDGCPVDGTGSAGIVVAYGAPSRPHESSSGWLIATDSDMRRLFAYGTAHLSGATFGNRTEEMVDRAALVLGDVVEDTGPVVDTKITDSDSDTVNGWTFSRVAFTATLAPEKADDADLSVECAVTFADVAGTQAWALVAERADAVSWSGDTLGTPGNRFGSNETKEQSIRRDVYEWTERLSRSLRMWDLASQTPWSGD